MAPPVPHDALARALRIVAYDWATSPDAFRGADEIELLEALRTEAAAFPEGGPLAGTYGSVVRLAGLALTTLASLPPPDEVDGLTGFAGFDLWQDSRPT